MLKLVNVFLCAGIRPDSGRRCGPILCLPLLAIAVSGPVFGQHGFPDKPLRILTGAAGGSSDVSTRLIAQGLSANVGQPVVVDSRPTVLIREIVAKAPPDGYTLLLSADSFYLGPLLQDDAPYDPVRDFSPVTLAIKAPSIFAVRPSLPVKSLQELIASAKARPGVLNYASGAAGSTYHLGPELFKAMAGVDIVRIPYKGSAPALAALLGDQVDMMFVTPASGSPHIKSGRLRALAITSLEPSILMPGIPTVAASGLPGFEVSSKVGIYAPGKTPPSIINRLNEELVRVLQREDTRRRFLDLGLETAGSSPQEFTALIKSEMAKMGKLIKDAGIRGDQ